MKLIIILFFTLFVTSCFGQDSTDVDNKFKYYNNVQIEILGSGAVYSVNYERTILNGNRFKTLAQIGISFWGNKSWKGFVIPIAVNELISFNRHHIEVGTGVSPNFVWRTDQSREWDYFLMGRIGYRYQNPKKKFIFRIGYTPIILPEFGHWGGVAFGYCF